MLGRRGPVQAAFTPPELKELGELAGADVIVDPADLELDPASERALEADRERARRNVDLLREYAARRAGGQAAADRAALPRLAGRDPRRATGSRRSRSCATSSSRRTAASSRRPTGETEVIPAGLVLRSVGYQGVALPGRAVRRATRRDPERRRPGRRAPSATLRAPAGSSAARAA